MVLVSQQIDILWGLNDCVGDSIVQKDVSVVIFLLEFYLRKTPVAKKIAFGELWDVVAFFFK